MLRLDDLAEVLADLLGTEGANSVEAETKYKAIFLAQADVEAVGLRRYRATVPGISERDGGAN